MTDGKPDIAAGAAKLFVALAKAGWRPGMPMPQVPGMPAHIPQAPMAGVTPGFPAMPGMPGMMPGMGGMPGMPGMPGMMGGMGALMANPLLAGIRPPPPKDDGIHKDVQELCDHFHIEERWIKRLNETMMKRKDTLHQDLEKLYEVLEHARSPTGLLTVKIGEMESGQFVGKIKPDKDVLELGRKYKLDEHIKSRLTELVVRRRDTKEEDLARLDKLLKYAKRPCGLATVLVGKLLECEMEMLPTLYEAEDIMRKYKLDEDACSKLAEICLKRHDQKEEILEVVKRHLEGSVHASAMLCKIAGKLIDGENLPPPTPRPGGNSHMHNSGGDRDRDRNRDRSRDRRDRSRDKSRDRRRRRSRSRSRRKD